MSRLTICAFLCLLFTLNGCQVLGIPSYRMGEHQPTASMNPADESIDEEFWVCDSASCADANCTGHSAVGLRSGGIPVPAWFARWQEKRNLPEPPPYPRFHPLPTRPMFAPQSSSADMSPGQAAWQANLNRID